MPDAYAAISHEQKAAAEFISAMSHIRAELERREDRDAVLALTQAALRFGSCELGIRRSERLKVAEVQMSEANNLAKAAMIDNKLGLEALPGVRPLVVRLSKAKTEEGTLSRWRRLSPRIRKEWRQKVADLDVDAAKAKQLIGLADEVCAAADEGGVGDVGRYVADRLRELEKLRRSKNRGTQAASFPYWKIVVAAALWGIGIGVTIDLLSRGAPWYDPFLVWLAIALFTFCIAIGC